MAPTPAEVLYWGCEAPVLQHTHQKNPFLVSNNSQSLGLFGAFQRRHFCSDLVSRGQSCFISPFLYPALGFKTKKRAEGMKQLLICARSRLGSAVVDHIHVPVQLLKS